jgi:hypothetical protein
MTQTPLETIKLDFGDYDKTGIKRKKEDKENKRRNEKL